MYILSNPLVNAQWHCIAARKAQACGKILHLALAILSIIPVLGQLLEATEFYANKYFQVEDPVSAHQFRRHVKLFSGMMGDEIACAVVDPVELRKVKQGIVTLISDISVKIHPEFYPLTKPLDGCCSSLSLHLGAKILKEGVRTCVRSLQNTTLRASKEIAAKQYHMNTIWGVRTGETDSCRAAARKSKWDAMAKMYGMKAEEVAHFKNLKVGPKNIDTTLKSLRDGVYIWRMVISDKAAYGDVSGHTQLYVKDGGREYIYEPNDGFYRVSPSGNGQAGLWGMWKGCPEAFCHEFDQGASLYRLTLVEV